MCQAPTSMACCCAVRAAVRRVTRAVAPTPRMPASVGGASRGTAGAASPGPSARPPGEAAGSPAALAWVAGWGACRLPRAAVAGACAGGDGAGAAASPALSVGAGAALVLLRRCQRPRTVLWPASAGERLRSSATVVLRTCAPQAPES